MMKTPIGIKRSLDTLENSARADGAAAERASIVAWIRRQSKDGWFSVLDAANGIERGEHAQPEPARQTCGECDYDPDHLYHDCADNPGTKPEPTHEDGECPVRP